MAVDELSDHIQLTGVGRGLGDHVEYDRGQVVEAPAADPGPCRLDPRESGAGEPGRSGVQNSLVLTGELVTLRPIEPDDYPTLNRFANDVEVELLGGGDPPSPTPQASSAAAYEQQRENPDSINFAITANEANSKLIGQCGLWRHDQLGRTVELGITIGVREYWGRGYGREAVTLLVDYAFRLRNLRKVHLSVHASNTRAIRCYAAAGFVEEGRLREQGWSNGAYVDLVLMGRLRQSEKDL